MNTKSFFVTVLFLSSLLGYSQNVPFSSNASFSTEVKFEPLVFEKMPMHLPVTILSLSKIRLNLCFAEIPNYPLMNEWARKGQQLNDVRILNPYYRRQDVNGRDLPQDVISKEMINDLIRRNYP